MFMSAIVSIFPGLASMVNPKVRYVLDVIQSDTVVIFSKSTCPYCAMAKEAFHKLNYPYTAIELDKRRDGDEIQGILHKLTGAKSVPRVFIFGNFVGGGTEIREMYENGKLRKLLMG